MIYESRESGELELQVAMAMAASKHLGSWRRTREKSKHSINFLIIISYKDLFVKIYYNKIFMKLLICLDLVIKLIFVFYFNESNYHSCQHVFLENYVQIYMLMLIFLD